MADNVGYTEGSGKTIAADDIDSVLYQRVKLAVGADGAAADLAPGQAAMAASLPVVIANNQSAVPVSDSSGSLTVDSPQLPAALAAGGGLPIEGVAGGVAVPVSVATVPSHAVTNAGTFAVQESGAALTALQLIDDCISGSEAQVDVVAALPAGDNNIGNVDIVTGPTAANALQVQGTVAHDSAAANNPLLAGATAANAQPAAVASGDVVKLIADLVGRQIVAPYTMPEKAEQYTSAADITDTADDEVFAAVASTVHYITHFSAMCSHATTGTWVYLKDNDTVIYSGYCAPAGGGFVATFPVPLKCTAGVHVNVANATTSSATRVNVSGYQGV